MNKSSKLYQQSELKQLLLSTGAHLIGFADISNMDFPDNRPYQVAIAIGLAYDPQIIAELDTEFKTFERHFHDTVHRLERLLQLGQQVLQQQGYAIWVPPISTNRPGLLSEFSHKLAATKAGLGWIGKSSLFISKDFGPAVCLATLLTSAPFQPGTPVTRSDCGQCMECVKACPYHAIHGVNWYPGIARDQLFDAFLCSRKREAFLPKIGFKHPCGLCIQACPIGIRVRNVV